MIDRSSLKKGDNIEIIDRFEKNRVFPINNNDQYPIITAVDIQNNSVILDNFAFTPDDAKNYNLRRVLNKAKTESEKTLLKYGNNNLLLMFKMFILMTSTKIFMLPQIHYHLKLMVAMNIGKI